MDYDTTSLCTAATKGKIARHMQVCGGCVMYLFDFDFIGRSGIRAICLQYAKRLVLGWRTEAPSGGNS